MSTPKHRTAPGSSYFVTTKCWQGRTVLQVQENAEILIEALFHYRDSKAYALHEFVVMPDHLHLMLTPGATTSLEKAIQLIKGGSSYQIRKARNKKIEIWQVGFHDWTLRDATDWQTKREYIHTNPVRAKLVQRPEDWPYSSANGKFSLDTIPDKFLKLSSGSKAQTTSPLTQGLKPLPPKESSKIKGAHPQAKVAKA
jgi:REP-associated tyrosine transposase